MMCAGFSAGSPLCGAYMTALLEQVVAQQPVRARRASEHADAQRAQLLRRQLQQIVRRLQLAKIVARRNTSAYVERMYGRVVAVSS